MTEDDLRRLRQRLAGYEPRIVAAFLAWVARLIGAVPLPVAQRALETGISNEVLAVVREEGPFVPDLADVYLAEGRHAMEEVPKHRGLDLSFNMQDPGFEVAVHDQGAFLVSEIDMETRRAIQMVVAKARRDGLHPRQFAAQIQGLVGLTARQALSVENQLAAMVAGGAKPEIARRTADRYAARLRRSRARMIARTETMRAANLSRRASFEQAAQHGLFDSSRAWREWLSVQTDPKEICFQLNGTKVRFDQEFPLGDPPLHPLCRCVTWLGFD